MQGSTQGQLLPLSATGGGHHRGQWRHRLPSKTMSCVHDMFISVTLNSARHAKCSAMPLGLYQSALLPAATRAVSVCPPAYYAPMAAFAERAWPDERHTLELHHHMVGSSLHVCRTVSESCAVSVVTSHCCLTGRLTACHSFAVPHTDSLVSTGFNPTFTLTTTLCAASGIKQPIHADFWRIPDHPQPDSKSG